MRMRKIVQNHTLREYADKFPAMFYGQCLQQNRVMRCTRIVIAHRLSTIRRCDRIIVLEGGKIVEDGNYEELLALGGRFADLIERQRLDI